ncbi:hypothetical protein HDU96_000676 [Phlyctochytrium bullatum]|nr:hypothetical protein HDU96_000676 [Phlyctochytrium bullatum]
MFASTYTPTTAQHDLQATNHREGLANGPLFGPSAPSGAWRGFQLMAEYGSDDEFDRYWDPDPEESSEVEEELLEDPATAVPFEGPVKQLIHAPVARESEVTVAETEAEAEVAAPAEAVAPRNSWAAKLKTKNFKFGFLFKLKAKKADDKPRDSSATAVVPRLGEDARQEGSRRAFRLEDVKKAVSRLPQDPSGNVNLGTCTPQEVQLVVGLGVDKTPGLEKQYRAITGARFYNLTNSSFSSQSSTTNPKIVARFICDRLGDACRSPKGTIDACTAAIAGLPGNIREGVRVFGEGADRFNLALGITTNFADQLAPRA